MKQPTLIDGRRIYNPKIFSQKLKFAGGADDGRGWKGNVKNILLDIGKNQNPRLETQTQHQTSHNQNHKRTKTATRLETLGKPLQSKKGLGA